VSSDLFTFGRRHYSATVAMWCLRERVWGVLISEITRGCCLQTGRERKKMEMMWQRELERGEVNCCVIQLWNGCQCQSCVCSWVVLCDVSPWCLQRKRPSSWDPFSLWWVSVDIGKSGWDVLGYVAWSEIWLVRRCRDVFEYIRTSVLQETLRKPRRTWVMMSGNPGEIRTGYIPNTRQVCYHYTNLRVLFCLTLFFTLPGIDGSQ
jgi:hypothetical protein